MKNAILQKKYRMHKFGRFVAACAAVLCALGAAAGGKSSLDYVQGGLIAHWDGCENAGRLVHDDAATTWKDLTGKHEDMVFPNGPNIGECYYDMVGATDDAGGYISDAADIATAINKDYSCTIEIVCDFRSQVSEGTVFALLAGNSIDQRLLWLRSSPSGMGTGCLSHGEYNSSAWYATPNVDNKVWNCIRTYAFKCGSDSCAIFKDGVALNKTLANKKLSNVDVSTAWFSIGRRRNAGGVSAAVADMKVYAVRVYDRQLTPGEIAANAAVDEARFVNGEYDLSGFIIGNQSEGTGDTNPAAGKLSPSDGETVVCTAAAAWTNAEETVRADCIGWKFYDLVSGELLRSSADSGEQPLAFSHTYAEDTVVQLVWQWAAQSKIFIMADGGTVTGSDGWHDPGERVTVSVTPDDGLAFGSWTGDVDSAKRFDNPLAFVMGNAPVSLTANFRKVIYVSKTGKDTNGGTSWNDALATVEEALTREVAPYVLVGEGCFDISTAIKVTTAATICGSGDRDTVFRLNTVPSSGNDTRAVFYVKNSEAILKNLAMTTGGSARGRGLDLDGGTVEDCSITNCVANDMNGGGVYLASGTLRNSYIYYNEASSSGGNNKRGGGIYMTGGTVDRCIVRQNDVGYLRGAQGSGLGGGIYMTGGTVRNSLFYDNFARSSGMALEISGGTVENCTIVRNGKTSIGYNAVNATGSPTIRNTIVRGNLSTTGSEANLSLDASVKLENVMSLGSSREEIITDDPAFVDAEGGDWHILYGAAVDAGVDEDWMETGLDLDGKARISGKHVDIGCYEYVSSGLACGFDVTTDGALDEAIVTLTGSVVGADESDVTFTWTLTDDRGNETERVVVGSGILELPMPIGRYSVRIAVSDGINSAEAPERPNAFTVYAEHLYVSPEGSNEYPYGDFATAATNIEDIISFASDGSTVHLSDGVHWLKDRLAINDGIVIEHAGDPMDAVVTGGRTGTCLILLNHEDAKLSGLDICGSYPDTWVPGAAAPTKSICSGVRILAGGTVTNCVIEGCYGQGGDKKQGGGIDMVAGQVVDCIIRNNREVSSGGDGVPGGGVYIEGGTVDRCVITNNWASPGSTCKGGGVYIKGGTLRNSLIAYCKTSGGGGGVYQAGGSVRNCTIVYNSSDVSNGGASGTVTDCLTFGNMTNGQIEKTEDPGFRSAVKGDFHLSPGSAAIDASVTEGIGESDLDGNPRYQGKEEPIADKGCYETDPNVFELGVDYVKLATFYPAEVVFTATAGGPALDENASWWTFDGREPTTDDHDAIGICVTNTLPPAEYTVRFKTIFEGQPYEVVKEKWFVLNGETVYVNPENANPAVPFASWETAAADINAAFPYLIAGTTMVVSDGTYRVSVEQNLNRQVTIRSLNGPTVTKFTGSRPFHLNSPLATVADFAFENFKVWDGGAVRLSNGTVSNCVFASCAIQTSGGAAVYMTAGTLVDCVATNCSTYYSAGQPGAAIRANGANALIDRCIVTGSYWQEANTNNAAVALEGGAKMRNSVVLNNRGGATGGVLLTGASAMENCTVTGNTACFADGAGGVSAADTASVVNTIVWNNTNTTDKVLRETTGDAGRFDTCWTEDPVFKPRGDNWQLRTTSPCMNAGKPLDWMDGATDFYGNPRVRYGKPDIGAAESPYDPGLMLIVR